MPEPISHEARGLHFCGYGLPGQLFYALNLLEEKAEHKDGATEPIRAIISVLEGRGTRYRIRTKF